MVCYCLFGVGLGFVWFGVGCLVGCGLLCVFRVLVCVLVGFEFEISCLLWVRLAGCLVVIGLVFCVCVFALRLGALLWFRGLYCSLGCFV